LSWTEIAERILTLEAAIDQVELDSVDGTPSALSEHELIDRERPKSTAVTLRPISQDEVVFDDGTAHGLPSFLHSARCRTVEHALTLSTIPDADDRADTGRNSERVRLALWRTILSSLLSP
jgi:hypothetical protein